MLRLIRLTAIPAALLTGAMLTTGADAGHCYRPPCHRPTVYPSYPPPWLEIPGPGIGGPGALPPDGVPGLPGGPGDAGPGGPVDAGPGGPGVEATGGTQGVAGAQGAGNVGAQGAGNVGAQGVNIQIANVPAGATVALPGARGTQRGEVNLVLGNVRLPLTIVDWNENGVTVTLPTMQINQATPAQFEIKVPGANTPEAISIQLQPRPAVLVVQ